MISKFKIKFFFFLIILRRNIYFIVIIKHIKLSVYRESAVKRYQVHRASFTRNARNVVYEQRR